VEKHQHYQEQLELSHQKLKHVEALGDEDHIMRNKEKYNTLAEKAREMGYKVELQTGFYNYLHFCDCPMWLFHTFFLYIDMKKNILVLQDLFIILKTVLLMRSRFFFLFF